MSIRIAGTGSYVPDRVMTNADLEKMVETSDEWIRTRTGIQERRIAAPEQATSDLAYEAGKRALEMAGITGDQLSVIIVATITPDHVFPSTGCILQKRFGASNAFCFDLEAACSGLLYSLEVGHSLMKANPKYKYALVIGAEKLSSITDWTDRNTCVLFGDGAGAVVLENTGAEGADCLLASDLHAIHMAGRETFKLAVNAMVSACKKTLEDANVAPSEIRMVVPHQANQRIIQAVAQRLDVANDRVFENIGHYGNTSAASIGICLDEVIRSGDIERGDYLLLTAFGGGLTWGAILLRY